MTAALACNRWNLSSSQQAISHSDGRRRHDSVRPEAPGARKLIALKDLGVFRCQRPLIYSRVLFLSFSTTIHIFTYTWPALCDSLQQRPLSISISHPPTTVIYANNTSFPSLPHPVRLHRPGKNVHILEHQIRGLCLKSREIFLSQPILLELEAPLKICGK